jgi:hypothetical protein
MLASGADTLLLALTPYLLLMMLTASPDGGAETCLLLLILPLARS